MRYVCQAGHCMAPVLLQSCCANLSSEYMHCVSILNVAGLPQHVEQQVAARAACASPGTLPPALPRLSELLTNRYLMPALTRRSSMPLPSRLQ